MTKEEIYEKANSVVGIEGMTGNERLYVSGLMNVLKVVKTKKPFKSYDLKGFNSICFSAGGERG
ncbi:hypothetical protein [uncultured Flavobacterium sp.]|uniref:hypothetical protein n=1 Tax=uncultured Flavobacterium sp. TaxID=165435 RepID=UPI0030CA17F1|tara:strand:- start:149 stop:340 length:192 start_codon:yes stop_codon:yes gene_type:complete